MPRVIGGSPCKLLRRAPKAHPHNPARLGKMTGRDKAIAAVIARSAQDRHPGRLPTAGDLGRDSGACGLHQRRERRARSNRPPVYVRHLRRGQKYGAFGQVTLTFGWFLQLGDYGPNKTPLQTKGVGLA